MKIAQRRQKCYIDNKRRHLKFKIGDRVFLKVAPMQRVMRIGKKDKLSPRYIGPQEIFDKIGDMVY